MKKTKTKEFNPTNWLKHLNLQTQEKERGDLKSEVLRAKIALERLSDMVEEQITVVKKNQFNKNNYELASWSALQADCIGELRGLVLIKKYLNEALNK